MLGLQTKRGWLHRLSQDEQKRLAEEMIKALAIATPDADKPVGQLSGGNQQKVVLARSLASQPKVLLLDEPTRGIDVGAHAEIVALIRRLCTEGPGAAGGLVGARRAGRRQRPRRGAARPPQGRRDRRRRHHPREHHSHDCRRMTTDQQTSAATATTHLRRAAARHGRPPRGLAAAGAGGHPDRRRLRRARLLHHPHRRGPPVRQPDRHPLSRHAAGAARARHGGGDRHQGHRPFGRLGDRRGRRHHRLAHPRRRSAFRHPSDRARRSAAVRRCGTASWSPCSTSSRSSPR